MLAADINFGTGGTPRRRGRPRRKAPPPIGGLLGRLPIGLLVCLRAMPDRQEV